VTARRAVVVGGGIAGIQAALDIAAAGHEVVLVEKEASLGGHMIQYSEVFPTLDCPQCIMTPKMVEAGQHPRITLMTYSEVESVSGSAGDFNVRVRRKPPFVDWQKCTSCGDCAKACPVTVDSEFNAGISARKAIYVAFAQAVPNKYVVDKRGTPPCRAACPAGVNAQGYIALISQRKFKEALELVRRTIPFAGVCGRVCTHRCELQCESGKYGEPMAIRDLKRFLADYEARTGVGEVARVEQDKRGRVAVVGSGPAGLACAYDLVRKGYSVTVLEGQSSAGGLLRYGIPEYRLPRSVLDREIAYIQALGVEIKTAHLVSDPRALFADGYRAVYLAIGAWKGQRLNIPGEEAAGVMNSLEFLHRVNSGDHTRPGKRVVVVGGGNAAIDAARVARRLGCADVTILYRRSREEMPASAEEVAAAEQEGVKLRFLANPVRVISHEGSLARIECVRMILGEADTSGRRRPTAIPGSEFSMEADSMILAVGQAVDDQAGPTGLVISRDGAVLVDPVTLETSVPGIFCGGDAARGPADVITAIADGKEAAESIHRFLSGSDLRQGRRPHVEPVRPSEHRETSLARAAMPQIPLDRRVDSFAEVERGFDEETAVREAGRCLNCGVCSECLECVKACGAGALDHGMTDRFIDVPADAIVIATGFDLLGKDRVPEFEADKDVMHGIQFERLLCPGGPTAGRVLRPSDGKVPKEVVFISCTGSRDPEHGVPYCSRVCCMYLAKMAMLYKHAVPDGQAYIFYMDVRSTGKNYEEFIRRAVEEGGAMYLRGRVSRVFRDGEDLVVWGADTLSGKAIQIRCDAVVLGMAMLPSHAGLRLAEKIGVLKDEHGFITEMHHKVRPQETSVPGIYLAGTAQGPRDIPDTVAQASAAAARVLVQFSSNEALLKAAAH
jgi:heterodisulfide reductase subunit A2